MELRIISPYHPPRPNKAAQPLVAGASAHRETLEETLPGPAQPVIGRLPRWLFSASRLPAALLLHGSMSETLRILAGQIAYCPKDDGAILSRLKSWKYSSTLIWGTDRWIRCPQSIGSNSINELSTRNGYHPGHRRALTAILIPLCPGSQYDILNDVFDVTVLRTHCPAYPPKQYWKQGSKELVVIFGKPHPFSFHRPKGIGDPCRWI